MKLLFENWRGYISEESGCMTVGSLLDTINKMQKGEKAAADKARLQGWSEDLVKELIGLIPVIGDAAEAAFDLHDVLKKAKDQMAQKDMSYDDVSQYPILGHLKIDPELIKVLDDEILSLLDEQYEKTVLSGLSPNTCIDKIPSINDFIRDRIKQITNNRVVIVTPSK